MQHTMVFRSTHFAGGKPAVPSVFEEEQGVLCNLANL